MTICVKVPPELENRLREHAAAAGKDLETLALEALEEKVGRRNGSYASKEAAPPDQRVSDWLSWTASHPGLGYVVDDSRESIYTGRGE